MRRVALAGVVAMQPRVLVMDEPIAGLDPKGRDELTEVIRELHDGGVTIVLISHNMDDAAAYAARLLVTASYEHNAAVSMQNLSMVPYGFDMLIKPYMRLTSATEGDVQTVTLGSDVKIEFTADLPDGLLLPEPSSSLPFCLRSSMS